MIVGDYADKILSFDEECAQVWGRLMSPHPQHPIDKQIAAIALIHDLTFIDTNEDEFRELLCKSVNFRQNWFAHRYHRAGDNFI